MKNELRGAPVQLLITDHLIFLPRMPVFPVSLQSFEHEAKQREIEEEDGSEGGEGNPEGR